MLRVTMILSVSGYHEHRTWTRKATRAGGVRGFASALAYKLYVLFPNFLRIFAPTFVDPNQN